MAIIDAGEVRIPRSVREAVARHEEVIVMNHDRPTLVISNPEDRQPRNHQKGRPIGEALAALTVCAPPDPAFAEDMEAVLAHVGQSPEDLWGHS